MASDPAISVALNVRRLVQQCQFGSLESIKDKATLELAESIDDLLKNLLVARVDQYTVK